MQKYEFPAYCPNDNQFIWALSDGLYTVFELMACMVRQFHSRIGMYDIVDALMRHADTLPFQNP